MSSPAYALVNASGVVVSVVNVPTPPPGVTGTTTLVAPAGQTLVPTNGATVLPGYTFKAGVFTANTITPTLEALELAVDQQRDSLLAAGFADTGTGGTGKTWQCDSASRGLLTALGASAFSVISASPAVNFTLIAADNTTVTLTAANVYALINGRIMPWVSNMFMYGRTLKNLYEEGTPPPSITVGWPTK